MNASRRRGRLAALALGLLVLGGLYLRHRRAGNDVKLDSGKGAMGLSSTWRFDPDAPLASIEGIVRSADGQPFSGGLVAAIEHGGGIALVRGVVRSDAQGRFHLEHLRPGRYAVTASAIGRVAARKTLELSPGQALRDLVLTIGEVGPTLSGSVLDAGGGPIAQAVVKASPSGEAGSSAHEVVCDETGRYAITLPAGTYTFMAEGDGYLSAEHTAVLTEDLRYDFRLNPAATLRGKVVMKEGGAPVAEALVVAEPSDRAATARHQVESDGQGVFELHVDPGTYQFAASKGSLIGAGKAYTIALGGFVDGIVVEVAKGFSLSGTVRNLAGAPLEGAKVWLTSLSFVASGSTPATSASDGAFKLDGLPVGRHVLTTSAKGYVTTTAEPVAITAGDVTGIELKLTEAAELAGRVVDAQGQAVAGASVVIIAASVAATATTLADGTFRATELGGGPVHLYASHESHGHASIDLVAVKAGEKREDIVVTLEPGGSLAGTVRWDDGAPVIGASVQGLQVGLGGRSGTTDARGEFILKPLGKGLVSLSAMRPDDTSPRDDRGEIEVTMQAGEHKTGVQITLQRGGHRVSGLVLGADGKPLSGVAIAAALDPGGPWFRDAGGRPQTYSNPDGTFTVSDLAKGSYAIWASQPGSPLAVAREIAADTTGVRLQFRPGAVIAGTVASASGQSATDFVVSCTAGRSAPRKLTRVHDERGAFELTGLASGTYELSVSTSDGRVGRREKVELGEGEEKRGLAIRLDPGVTLRGRLVEAQSGEPIPDAWVSVMGGTPTPVARSDPRGLFSIDAGMAPGGTASLFVHLTGYLGEKRQVPIPTGTTTVELGTLPLTRGQE